MNGRDPVLGPLPVVQMVEQYVGSELLDAERAVNRQPLDESGVWSLHAMAARIYAAGFDAGRQAEAERGRAEAARAREAHRAEIRALSGDKEDGGPS